jgi:hypothetical protein
MVGQQQYLLTSCRSGRIRGAAQKGGKPNCIKPSVALLLLALHVQRIAAACLDIARDPGVERRDLKAVTPTPTPITYGRQGSFDEAPRAPRSMPNPAPTAGRDLRVDCSHMRTPNAPELARVLRRGLIPQVYGIA